MSTFHLKISTPDGLLFDGEVERVRARMIDGDVCLLAHHADYVSAVGAGEAAIASLIATTFEWSEDIDLPRAQHAKEVAQARIVAAKNDERELMLAEAKLRRALVRIGVKS